LIRAIFESHIPAWSNPVIRTSRIALWKMAGFNAVYLQIDDTNGATWPSTLMEQDARVSQADEPLRRAVDELHAAGFYVVLDFVFGVYKLSSPVKPQFSGQNGFYDFWNSGFREWRSDVVAEAANYVDADAVALDYIRTGRPANPDESPSADVVLDCIRQVRSKVDQSYDLLAAVGTWHGIASLQGVTIPTWVNSGLVDAVILSNYVAPVPYSEFEPIVNACDAKKIWPLTANYDMFSGSAVSRSGQTVAKDWKRLRRQGEFGGLGIYLANLLTDDQATHLNATQRMIGPS